MLSEFIACMQWLQRLSRSCYGYTWTTNLDRLFYFYDYYYITLHLLQTSYFRILINPSHSTQQTQGDDSNENEVHLDEEMARVFSDPSNSKFDVRKLSDVNPPSKSGTDYQQPQSIHSSHRYNEEDYECKSTFNRFLGMEF